MQSILSYFKEIIKRVKALNAAPSDTEAYALDNLISDDMARHFTLIRDLYENNEERIPWLNQDVKSLRLVSFISREIARKVLAESKITIDGTSERAQYLNRQFKLIKKKLPVWIEQGIAFGNLAFKPYVNNGDVFVDVTGIGGFIPVKIDSKGIFTACVFVQKTIYSNNVYTKLEYHHIDNGIYTIENTAYRSSAIVSSDFCNDIGVKVALTQVPEWASISPFVQFDTYDGTEPLPLYSIYRNPFANSIDLDSALGVSIVAECIDLIADADKTWEEESYEIKSGERRIFAPTSALTNIGESYKVSRFYKRLETDSDDVFHEFSPVFRNDAINARVQNIFKRIEQNAGMSFGIISDPQNVDKTATEINNSKERLHTTVDSIQRAFKACLEDLVEAMNRCCDLYGITGKGEYQLIVEWGDSIRESTQERQARALLEYQNGIIDEVEYFVTSRGISEEEAIKLAEKIKSRSPQQIGKSWFKGEE